jgi:ribose 5-phosphate isomerase B
MTSNGVKIYLGGDHAGFELKQKIKIFLEGLKYEVEDLGPFEYDPADDYPDFVKRVCEAVAKDLKNSRGILIANSGQGEAIIANRYKGVRAVVFYGGSSEILTLSRQHNDANVLSLGAHFLSEPEAKEAVKLWLETPFSNEERHKRRIQKIDK